MTGLLVLAGTPIGDVADASPALLRALTTADVIAAEDTRRFRALARRLGIEPAGRVVSYFEGNEAARTPELIAERDELTKQIAYLKEVLENVGMQMQIIKDELLEIKEKYGDERRSEIVYSSEEFNPEDFYADDDMVITIRIDDDRFWTTTPCRATSAGSSGSARCTRLLTLMAFWSGSVPISKLTVRLIVPEPVEVERM